MNLRSDVEVKRPLTMNLTMAPPSSYTTSLSHSSSTILQSLFGTDLVGGLF